MALRTVVVMNRRLALTFAGATAVVVTVAGGAMAANVGILSTTNQAPVGNLTAQSVEQLATRPAAEVAPSTTVADPADPVAPAAATSPVTSPTSSGSLGIAQVDPTGPTTPAPQVEQPAPVDTIPSYDDDDDHDDDDHDDDDHDDDDHDDDHDREHEDDDDD